MCAARRRSPEHAATRRVPPGAAGRDKSTPRACPTHSPRHLLFLSPSPRAVPSHSSRPPLPTARHRRHARSPPQKQVAQSVSSLAVVSYTFSTPPSVRLRRGKGKIAASSHRRHGCSRRRCCSTRTTATVTLPSLLCLALGSRNATVARRVALSGYDAVASSEPAVPWPSAAVAIATPSSHCNHCNRWVL